ncbi:hypothetical protein GQ600_23407 [Phytophthora cactorum]|nr:hypothetical protein GQ600_23407 [Phytophthora cactorum]
MVTGILLKLAIVQRSDSTTTRTRSAASIDSTILPAGSLDELGWHGASAATSRVSASTADSNSQPPTNSTGHESLLEAAARTDSITMTREEYEAMYSTLLYELTICWDEETNDAVQAKMWHRDASSFSNLDLNRFCCSISTL